MKNFPHKAEREDWILKWFRGTDGDGCKNYNADALNEDFHEAYHQKFPMYKRRETTWGSQPVAQAMTDLARMAKAGILERRHIGLGRNWEPGFPRYVMSYSLPEIRRQFGPH